MNLERIGAHEASRAYLQQTEATSSRPAAPADAQERARHTRAHHARGRDSVTVSDSARSLAAAREAVQSAPDVREQKVADVKQRVADGTYSVPARVLARKMLSTEQAS